jgi:hypothetical protein
MPRAASSSAASARPITDSLPLGGEFQPSTPILSGLPKQEAAFLGSPSVFAGVIVGSLASAKAERPNILLFLVDNLGCGKLGCYGQEVIRSRTLTGWPAKACRMNKLIERNL